MATIKLKDESTKTFSIDGVCYTKGDYRLQYNAKKEVLIIPKAVANISNLSGLPFKTPTAWTYFVDLDDNPYNSFEEFSLAISDAINFNLGEEAPSLQEVTDKGNITNNAIIIQTSDYEGSYNGESVTLANNITGAVSSLSPDGLILNATGGFGQGTITSNLLTDSRSYELPNQSGTLALLPEIENDFADDSAAATGGIAVGALYHTSGVVKIRLS